MGEKHKQYAVTTVEDVLYRLWDFVENSGQNAVRVVDDSGTKAVNNGTSFITPTSASDFSATGSYLVIEPVAEYPGGGRWQVQLILDSSDELDYVMSASGEGWNNAGEDFGADAAVTDQLQWNGGSDPGGGSTLYVSSSDLDTYNGGADKYSYLRCVIVDGGSIDGALYVGGYVPFRPSVDTRPVVSLGRNPLMGSGGSLTWGTQSSTSNNHNRIPIEYAHTSSLNAAGYTFTCAPEPLLSGHGKDYGSFFVAPTIYVCATAGFTLGVFGPYTMLGVDNDKALLDVDDDAKYLVINDFLMRWNESA